jgi:deoxyhypusine synthase
MQKMSSLWKAGKNARYWGALSGRTFEETQSWGKIFKDAKKMTLYCDCPIALPDIISAVAQESAAIQSRRMRPEMENYGL